MLMWSAFILLLIGFIGNLTSCFIKKGENSDYFAWIFLAAWYAATAWGIGGHLP